jgi:CheY-like chemotaxis protein
MTEPLVTIVVVEDENNIRRFIKLALESQGFQVFEADSLQRGLIEAGTRRPDLVVLDLGLPDGDGVDFIRDLRTWSEIPVIVLSARSAETDKVAALDSGADDYLTNPLVPPNCSPAYVRNCAVAAEAPPAHHSPNSGRFAWTWCAVQSSVTACPFT